MKRFFKRSKGLLSILVCCGILLAQIPFMATMQASATVAGTDPLIDPTINTDKTLPEGYDQGLRDGLPYGYFAVDEGSHYTFGVATDSKGNLYYASYTTGNICVKSKDAFGYISMMSEERTIPLGERTIFALALNSEDNIIYSVCKDEDGYVAMYDQKTGKITRLIEGLVRPCQCTVDAQDNVYVACESGALMKWTKATGEVSTVAAGLSGLQSVVVDKDGVIYALSYSVASDAVLIGVAIRGGTLYQINLDGSVEKVAGNNNQYVWRARGLCIDEDGYVYLSGEGNAWDNGNSSLIARYDPRTRRIEQVTAGMDYISFLTYGDDGRIYAAAARDDIVVAYSQESEKDFALQSGWDSVGGSRIITHGGSYTKGGSGNLSISVNNLTFTGTATADADTHKVSGWINIPVDSLTGVVTKDQEGGLRGVYKTPDVAASANSGTVRTTVIALRQHTRSRWPMIDLYTNAADFSEDPEAYLVYFEWTPENIATYRDTATTHDIYRNKVYVPASGAYNSAKLEMMDFSSSAAATQTDEQTDVTSIRFTSGKSTAWTRLGGNDLSVDFRFGESAGDWLGISLDNRQVSSLNEGVGLRLVIGKDGAVTARMVNSFEGLGWDAAASQTVFSGSLDAAFGDGEWHTLALANNFGEYEVTLDGHRLTDSPYAGFDADMAAFTCGTATYMTLYTATGAGDVEVKPTVSAPKNRKLTFLSQGEGWVHDIEEDTYTSGDFTEIYYMAADLRAGVEFNLKSSGISSWLYMNIGKHSSVFPDGDDFFYDFCHGKGLKLMLKDDGSVESRLVTVAGTSEGWENAPWMDSLGGVSGSGHFNDDSWHKIAISKASGAWSVKVDGRELLGSLTDAQRTKLNELLDDDTGYILFSGNGYFGQVAVQEIVEETTLPTLGNMTFAAQTGAWSYSEVRSAYVSGDFKNVNYMTAPLQDGVEFQLRTTDVTGGWLYMNMGKEDAVFPADDGSFYDFSHGTGLKLLLKNNGSVESRLVTESGSTGWNAPVWSANPSGVSSSGSFNDTKWHTVAVSKASGEWSVKIDGKEILNDLTSAQRTALGELLDAQEGVIVFSSNGYDGSVAVREPRADGEEEALIFAARNGKWKHNETDGTYTTDGFKNVHYLTADTESGIEFEVKSTGVSGGWMFLNIGNQQAVFPSDDSSFYDFCHGTGLKVLLKDDGDTEARLITEPGGTAWNNAAWKATYENVSPTGHYNDGTWHKIAISKESGSWSVKVDGKEMLTGLNSTQLTTLNGLLDGDSGCVVFSSNGYEGTATVRPSSVTPAGAAPLTFACNTGGKSWTHDEQEDTYSVSDTVNKIFDNGYYATADLAKGVSFQLKSSSISSLMFLNIGKTTDVLTGANYTAFTGATGLKVVLYNTGKITAKLQTVAGTGGWSSAPWTGNYDAYSATGAFNDDKWHRVDIGKEGGVWSVKVDGNELLAGLTADQRTAVNNMLDAQTGCILFSANGSKGILTVKDNYVAPPTPSDPVASSESIARLKLKIKVAKNLFNNTYEGKNYGQVDAASKEALGIAGKAAVKVAEDDTSVQETVDTAIEDLQKAIDAFKDAVIQSCDFTDLGTMIQSATTMFSRSSIGTDPGQVPAKQYKDLKEAIAHAVEVYRKSGVKQEELDEELEKLTSVVADFASAVVVDTTPIAFDWLTDTQATAEVSGVDTTRITMPIVGSMAYTEVNPINLTFRVRIDPSQNFEWFALNFSSSGRGRLSDGDGINAVFWLGYTADIRVVESVTGKGWEGAGSSGKQIFTGSLATDATDVFNEFNNGDWYEFKMSRGKSGGWTFTCNGLNLIANEYVGFQRDMDRLLGGGNTVTMSLYTNGAAGEVEVYQDTTGAKFTYTALDALVSDAEMLLRETAESRAPASAFDALRQAVASAKALKEDPGTVYSQVSAAKLALQEALKVFRDAIALTYDAAVTEQRIIDFGMDTAVTADNAYEALMVVDSYESLTDEQKSMVSDKPTAALERIRTQLYDQLRSASGVTVGGNNLPYYVRALVDRYEDGSDEWNEWFDGVDDPVALFDLAAENYLTAGDYDLGSDGAFDVALTLPEDFAKQTAFVVTGYYADGATEQFEASAANGILRFTSEFAGRFAITLPERAIEEIIEEPDEEIIEEPAEEFEDEPIEEPEKEPVEEPTDEPETKPTRQPSKTKKAVKHKKALPNEAIIPIVCIVMVIWIVAVALLVIRKRRDAAKR